MSRQTDSTPSAARPDRLPRLLSAAAFLVACMALVFSMGGLALSKGKGQPVVSGKPRPFALLRLDKHGQVPASAIPVVAKAQKATKALTADQAHKADRALSAEKLAGATRQKLTASCPISAAIDLGSWCLEASTYKIPAADVGKNNYLYATQKCVEEGGWLPTAAQLIGAAPKAALKSTLDDDPATSGTSEFPEARNGIKDEREMTSDLFTVGSGARAAGSEGVTAGSKGNTTLGEPNPLPVPAEPLPETLDYVTVYDNHNLGGFAGGEPVGKPENFRCAYAKGYQGKPRDVSSRS
jgi:hypothetical protein